MKEPRTVEECLALLRAQAAQNPQLALFTLVDQLVDLACSGGNPIRGPLHDHLKVTFYKTVIATLATKHGIRP